MLRREGGLLSIERICQADDVSYGDWRRGRLPCASKRIKDIRRADNELPLDRAVPARMQTALHGRSGRGVQGQDGDLSVDEIRADIVRESQRANAAGVDLRDATSAQLQPGRDRHCS